MISIRFLRVIALRILNIETTFFGTGSTCFSTNRLKGFLRMYTNYTKGVPGQPTHPLLIALDVFLMTHLWPSTYIIRTTMQRLKDCLLISRLSRECNKYMKQVVSYTNGRNRDAERTSDACRRRRRCPLEIKSSESTAKHILCIRAWPADAPAV